MTEMEPLEELHAYLQVDKTLTLTPKIIENQIESMWRILKLKQSFEDDDAQQDEQDVADGNMDLLTPAERKHVVRAVIKGSYLEK